MSKIIYLAGSFFISNFCVYFDPSFQNKINSTYVYSGHGRIGWEPGDSVVVVVQVEMNPKKIEDEYSMFFFYKYICA